MKKTVLTRELLNTYLERWKTRKHGPHRLYCSLCSSKDRISYFREGETVYRVDYPNGPGFYHISCVDNPKKEWQKWRVERIRALDPDKYKDLEDFIEKLQARNLSTRQMIQEVMSRYGRSHVTAWRRLKGTTIESHRPNREPANST